MVLKMTSMNLSHRFKQVQNYNKMRDSLQSQAHPTLNCTHCVTHSFHANKALHAVNVYDLDI